MRATTTGVVARLNLFYSAVCRDEAYKCTFEIRCKVTTFFELYKIFVKNTTNLGRFLGGRGLILCD